MGFIVETGIPELGIEIRSESIYVHDCGTEPQQVFAYPSVMEGQHYSNLVEFTKPQLKRLLEYFDDPEQRKQCGGGLAPPARLAGTRKKCQAQNRTV